MSDEFEDLLAKRKPVEVDEFEALTRGKPARSAPAAKASIPGAESHDAMVAGLPPPRKMGAGEQLATGLADAVDFVFTGLPGMALSAVGEGFARLNAAGAGKSRKEASAEGERVRQGIQQQVGTPVRTTLQALGLIGEDAESGVSKASGWVGEKIEELGAAVEKRTGGTVAREDVTMLLNGAMGGAGVKGMTAGARRVLDAKKAKAAAAELDKMVAERQAEGLAPPEMAAVEPAAAPPTPPRLQGAERIEAMRLARAERARVRQRITEEPAGESTAVSPDEVDLRLPAVVGGAGIAAAMALAPDDEEKAYAAAAAGAMVAGRGRGLEMRNLVRAQDTAPLGLFLNHSNYTFSTLEKLNPQSSSFNPKQIRDLLKRQEVTKFERDAFESALADLPPDQPVTAKQLLIGLKKATGDFELVPEATKEFAGYGLDRIGRVPEYDGDFTHQLVIDGEKATPSQATTIYRSPLDIGTSNHFNDPNYFAHTRSFEEGGIRHVVEVQSDVAQKAAKKISEEERAALTRELEKATIELPRVQERARRAEGLPLRVHAQGRMRELETQIAELQSKLSAGRETERADPMFKRWDKRIIREEVAAAASRGEERIRFADADTVAKVEGWPKRITYTEGATAFDPQHTHYQRVGSITLSDGSKTFGEYKLTGNLRVKKGKVEAELQGPDGKLVWAPEGTIRFHPEGETAKALGAKAALHREHQGIYDRYSTDITKFLKQLGAKHLVDEHGAGWWEVDLTTQKNLGAGGVFGGGGRGVRLQMGAADPKMLAAITALGGTAAATAYLSSPEERARNTAITTALVGLAGLAKSRVSAVADWAETAQRGAERAIGVVSREVRKISPAVLRRMTTHERDLLISTHDRIQKVAPFVEMLKTVPKDLRKQLDAAMLTGEKGDVAAILGRMGKPDLVLEWKKVRAELDAVGKELVGVRRLRTLLNEYYPRIVTDVPGLLEHLGTKESTALERILREKNEAALKRTGDPLSPFEASLVVNRYLAKPPGGTGRPGFLKQRKLAEITPDLLPFYAPAAEALPLYIRAATREVERAKFFGRDLVRDAETGQMNLNASIGNVVNAELSSGNITWKQAEQLRRILADRFGPGERAAAAPLQTYKNLTYTALLGNPLSAATQMTDVAAAAAIHGLMPTLKSVQALVTRKPSRWTLSDMGLVNHLADEFVGGTKKPLSVGRFEISSARFLDKALKWSGFSAMDELGKLTQMNAAAAKYQTLARTAKGQEQIRRTYGEYFGPDVEALLADLRAGQKTRLVGELVFRELSDVQPLSKIEMPQAYLANPNARFMWTLKSFMIRQINLARERGIDQIRKGNVLDGSAFLARYAIVLGAAGAGVDAIKDWMLGRNNELEWNDIPENVAKTFGWSSYVVDEWRKGNKGKALSMMAAPPWKMFEEISNGDPKAVQYLPWVGKFLYNWEFGGREKAEAAKDKKKRESSLTEAEREERAERRRLARERREQRLKEKF